MTTSAPPPAKPATVPGPICHHCDGELQAVGFFQWAQGLFMILCVYCPHCRRELSTQVIPNLALMQQPEDPRIHMPH